MLKTLLSFTALLFVVSPPLDASRSAKTSAAAFQSVSGHEIEIGQASFLSALLIELGAVFQ